MASRRYLGLDVGEKRIGIAQAEDGIRIAVALETIEVDGHDVERIIELILRDGITDVVFGYPRNQSGEATAQTQFVEHYATKFDDIDVVQHFQDESLTSVIAEERLKVDCRSYKKADIDAMAACIILEDYLGTQ